MIACAFKKLKHAMHFFITASQVGRRKNCLIVDAVETLKQKVLIFVVS